MSLGSSVALVAAGLAVAGGTSYVSLMHGGASHAPGAPGVVDRAPASITQLSAYLDATFSSLQTTERAKSTTVRVASREVTGSVTSSLSFADRFGSVFPAADMRSSDGVKTRSLSSAGTLRVDDRAPAPGSYRVASYAPSGDDTSVSAPFTLRADIRVPPLRQAVTQLVPMANAPFPYDSGSSKRFFNVGNDGARGHRNFRGRVLWEKDAYSDPRVLLHIPKGFDITKPSVMIVFFHGHGATLTRDVLERQQVPEQISEAGVNAVLVAPQLAVNANDSSAGRFWESYGFARFIGEAGAHLARLHGDRRTRKTFATLPVVIVAYSGGYVPAAWALAKGGSDRRVLGVLLLDALYGEVGKYADFIASHPNAFFISAYTSSSARGNESLQQYLAEHEHPFTTSLPPRVEGTVAFLRTSGVDHEDFVTRAWTDDPIRDVLQRLGGYTRDPTRRIRPRQNLAR